LHLLKAVTSEEVFNKIKFVHFVKENEFDEIEQFRQEIEQR